MEVIASILLGLLALAGLVSFVLLLGYLIEAAPVVATVIVFVPVWFMFSYMIHELRK